MQIGTEVHPKPPNPIRNPQSGATIHSKNTNSGSAMVFDPSKAGKSLCACGAVAETFGGFCDRCASLQTLGLSSTALPEEIEKSYFTLVRVWHPDRFAHDPRLRAEAEEKLKEINAAHDYLLANPRQQQRDIPRPEKTPPAPRPVDTELEGEETEEVRRILRRREKSPVPGILLKLGFAFGAVAVLALLWLTGDTFLSSNSTLARPWGELKAQLRHDFAVFEPSSASQAQAAPAPAPQVPAPQDSTQSAPPASSGAGTTHIPHLQGAQPYVTAGLTPMEVLSVLGKPTSSTGEKMFYKSSEIDFKNGQVSGWKIDPASPIRVKLWSESPVVPGLNTFRVGSSKSDVIALQGTPTLFSDNEFGYGNSRVFFQNNRVTSWKEDPGSVALRVAH